MDRTNSIHPLHLGLTHIKVKLTSEHIDFCRADSQTHVVTVLKAISGAVLFSLLTAIYIQVACSHAPIKHFSQIFTNCCQLFWVVNKEYSTY